jgi:hypothetical protein
MLLRFEPRLPWAAAVYRCRRKGTGSSSVACGFFWNPWRQRQTRQVVRASSANWRNAVDRAEKREFVAELNRLFTNAGSVVVAHYAGLTVAQMNDFGRKHALSRRHRQGREEPPCQDRSSRARKPEGVADLFEGQTVIAYCDDPVTAPKSRVEFTKVERQAGHSWWRDRGDNTRRRWGQGACRRCRRSTSSAQRLLA